MKWNQELRTMMYKRLVEKYGPHENWENRGYPKEGKKEEFYAFMEEVADSLRKLIGTDFKDGGPIMQFQHAITVQTGAENSGRAYNIIMNKAAAYEAGFITTKEFPTQMEMEIPNLWKEIDQNE